MKTKKSFSPYVGAAFCRPLLATLATAILIFSSISLSAYTPPPKDLLFTIHYQIDGYVHKFAISEKSLKPQWHFTEDFENFTNNNSLLERTNLITNNSQIKTKLPEIHHIIKNLDQKIHKPENNGNIHFNPDRQEKFWITGQEKGRALNTEKLTQDILNAIKSQKHTNITAIINDIEPTDPEKILSKIVKRSEYSTNFEDNAPRENNITLALESFDGLVIQPNERISFNKVVGKRNATRGFQEAKIIIDGEFVPGIGGGVCQASTTLFNAVLLSGLKIAESHNHSLPISYVPLGRDAMVSSAADLEFINNTDSPLYIESKVIDKGKTNTALVRIYGEAPKYKYKPLVELETLDQEEIVRGETPTQTTGYCTEVGGYFEYNKKILTKGYPPRKTKTYLDTYHGDELINSKLIRKSHYKGKEQTITYEKQKIQQPEPEFTQPLHQNLYTYYPSLRKTRRNSTYPSAYT